MKKDEYIFEYVEEGRYQGVIDSYSLASTQDSRTTFLNLNIAVALEDEELILHKAYITDVRRNNRLMKFLRACNILRGKKADFAKLVGVEVIFDVEYDSESGKMRVSDLELLEDDIDFSIEDEYSDDED